MMVGIIIDNLLPLVLGWKPKLWLMTQR